MAGLRKLSSTCDFGTFLDQALRDRFVCGLRSEQIQKRLLTEDGLSSTRALEIAQGMEVADRNTKEWKGTARPAADGHVMTVMKKEHSKSCRHCGRGGHEPKDCRYKDCKCHNCGKAGHIAPICKGKKGSRKKPDHKQVAHKTHYVETEPVNPDQREEFSLFTVNGKSSKPVSVNMEVEGKPLTMIVDTGAAMSLVTSSTFKNKFQGTQLQPSDVVLTTYTGEAMEVLGEFPVTVKYGKQTPQGLRLVVIRGDGPSLLGRNWLEKIRLDWRKICTVSTDQNATLLALLEKYEELFAGELGTIKAYKATLSVCESAKPVFCKARPVPIALKSAVEETLERLENDGVLEKVSYSEWAAPVVTVPKKDGTLRLCGDYRVSVNPALEVDQYPLPKLEDLLATLTGGKKFSKLDLTHAYNQLQLDDASRKFVTINTHRGLYSYTRLPFGVASAPAIFQKTMERMLQGIDGVVVYINDILVTGPTDEEHCRRLEEVMERLKEHGVRLNREKCYFMRPHVEYLGFRVDAQGLHATQEKLKAINEAPIPRNVTELRSFLGLLNYYGRFIPNLATIVHPLYQLLCKNATWKWSNSCNKLSRMQSPSWYLPMFWYIMIQTYL